MGMLLALTAIAALCMVPRVRAGGGSFYATVTNVTQLIADINYANTSGGTFTINLQPDTALALPTVNGSDAFGDDLLPIIGAPNAVNLTILGYSGVIEPQDATISDARLIEVAKGSSLTLDQMTLQTGYSDGYNGGAIYNFGTLVISNCALSGNTSYHSGSDLLGGKGGAIYNDSGTVIISDSFLSGNLAVGVSFFTYGGAIYNDSGTVKISHSTISGNSAYFSNGDYNPPGHGYGGGIYNNGTVTVENSSSITGNGEADWDVYNLGTLYLDGTSTIGDLFGSAIKVSPVLSINSWSSAAHHLVLSWSTNYTTLSM
jgi:hypothetical protein